VKKSESSGQDSVYVPNSSPTSPDEDEDEAVEKESISESTSLAAPVKSWKELECLDLFRNGHINERSLQVLERLELVKAQYGLLAWMTNTYPEFRYDPSRTNLMITSKSSHTGNSPYKNIMKRGMRIMHPPSILGK
jgi:hypothetical protein